MNILEKNMTDILTDLNENYGALSVKAEFETEGTSLEEAARLKELSDNSNLRFTVKIGGCEAVRDINDAKFLCADEIVAPMIETPYALKKFARAINNIYSDDEKTKIKSFINIETITGYSNFKDIILADEFSDLSGIVIGRSDMASSMDLMPEQTDSDIMFNMAYNMSEKMLSSKKDFIIGGNITPKAPEFLTKLPYCTKFETRKIIFDNSNTNINISDGIIKAINFEIMWIQNRRENYGIILQDDESRINTLKHRCCNTKIAGL